MLRLPGGGFAFASEMKALRTLAGIGTDIDPCSLGRYLTTGYTFDERTILKSVRRLPPASYLEIAQGKAPVVREYWDLAAAFGRRFSGSQAQAEATLRRPARRLHAPAT